MPDIATALVTGGAAFAGAGSGAFLKYVFDRKTSDRDNRRRKTESAIRHVRAIATQLEAVSSGLRSADAKYARQTFIEHVEDARAECAGLTMYGTPRIRSRAQEFLTFLSRHPKLTTSSELGAEETTTIRSRLESLTDELTEDWRLDEATRLSRTRP